MNTSSDLKRWENVGNLYSAWDARTQQIALLINSGQTIIEFGAGRRVLETFLPPNCSYTPSDIVDRGVNTIVCDLNDDILPPFDDYDVAVFSGVLEYINDVPKLIRHLSDHVDTILTSYATADNNKNREINGWVNNFSSDQFIKIFTDNGFKCVHTEKWKKQTIYKFVK